LPDINKQEPAGGGVRDLWLKMLSFGYRSVTKGLKWMDEAPAPDALTSRSFIVKLTPV
jgi:hypothetical protein